MFKIKPVRQVNYFGVWVTVPHGGWLATDFSGDIWLHPKKPIVDEDSEWGQFTSSKRSVFIDEFEFTGDWKDSIMFVGEEDES